MPVDEKVLAAVKAQLRAALEQPTFRTTLQLGDAPGEDGEDEREEEEQGSGGEAGGDGELTIEVGFSVGAIVAQGDAEILFDVWVAVRECPEHAQEDAVSLVEETWLPQAVGAVCGEHPGLEIRTREVEYSWP
ncbi:MAG TPA: hypothetical protein PK668_05170 [Myxococcota bacterium]|nr:hypothetical protein [Myxococcota bacterium]HRY92249.1 hypothetical protein [Myxococcota bacterium]